MVLEPQLMVADEPVSMLDVSIRAGVLNLMRGIIDEMKLAGLYISHDLSLIRHVCDQTAIMYLGRIVEIGPTEDVIMNPLHPYAQALLRAVPVPDIDQGGPMIPLEGEIPSPKNVPAGCRFHTRCPLAGDMCRSVEPGPRDVGSRRVECHLYEPASEMQPVTTQKEASLRLDRSRREE
jgi:peptide/nickel transport system ATP-binding protein